MDVIVKTNNPNILSIPNIDMQKSFVPDNNMSNISGNMIGSDSRRPVNYPSKEQFIADKKVSERRNERATLNDFGVLNRGMEMINLPKNNKLKSEPFYQEKQRIVPDYLIGSSGRDRKESKKSIYDMNFSSKKK